MASINDQTIQEPPHPTTPQRQMKPSKSTVDSKKEISFKCRICNYHPDAPAPSDLGTARGNTRRFHKMFYQLWKCPRCDTIRTLGHVNYHDIYKDYPLKDLRLDVFARGTLGRLLARLKSAGLKKNHTILDYGCGNGIFISFLQERGFKNVKGYDPYSPKYASQPRPDETFDCVVANDVIEHTENPRAFLKSVTRHVRPGGILYIGTATSEGVEMKSLDPHLMRLHLPFHRTIFSEATLHLLAAETGMQKVNSWQRSYMDTRRPFANYRFLDEFNKEHHYVLENAMGPEGPKAFLRRPQLLFYALFGSWFPSAMEPAIALRCSS